MNTLTHDEIRRLPPVVDLVTAARAFGLGRTLAYELARKDEFPCPVRRYGRLYRVLTSDLLATLGIEKVPENAAQATSAADDSDSGS